MVNVTDASFEASANATAVPVQGGTVIQQGRPTGTMSGNFIITKNDTLFTKLMDAMRDSLPRRITWAGLGGGKRIQAHCIVASVSLSKSDGEGSHTGSMQLTIIEGLPDIV